MLGCTHLPTAPFLAAPPFLRLSSFNSDCPKPGHFHGVCLASHQSSEPAQTPPATSESPEPILRRHNSVLLRHLREGEEDPPRDIWLPRKAALSAEERAELLEMALLRKRPPQFPGSVYARKPHRSEPNLPPLTTLLRAEDGVEEDEGLLMKAIEIRRKVTYEIFIEQMIKKGKFGITYSTNLASQLPEFLDLVMIEAATMKKLPEFSDTSFNLRARRVIEESNVVPLVRWMKHNSLSYHKIGGLICMSRGNLEPLRSRAEWLKSIHVKGKFIGVVLVRAGESMLWRGQEELDEIVSYLESSGVRMEWMGYVVSRCAELLAFSIEEVKTRVGFFMDLGMSDNDFGTMVYDCPKVLGFFTLEEMKEKVNYLKEFGLETKDVGRLLAFKPQLMVCSIEEKWKPLIKYFYYLGIDKQGLKRMLVIKPMLFCVDMETTIVPKVRFLQEIGIKSDAIGRMLVKFPPLLTYSLYKKIRPVVVFLLTKAGVRQKNIAKVISLAPELLGCSIARKLDAHVKYFLSLGIKLWQLGGMIADFPMLLRYNTDLLRPKYIYLRRTMVRPLRDLIEFPRFFSYSLEGRIIPRHKVMVENRVNFKLRYMLAWSDEEFEQRVHDAVERRQRFEAGLISPLDSENLEVDEIIGAFLGTETDENEDDFSDSGSDESEDAYSDSEGLDSSFGGAQLSSSNSSSVVVEDDDEC